MSNHLTLKEGNQKQIEQQQQFNTKDSAGSSDSKSHDSGIDSIEKPGNQIAFFLPCLSTFPSHFFCLLSFSFIINIRFNGQQNKFFRENRGGNTGFPT
jgi:hypothetical protein